MGSVRIRILLGLGLKLRLVMGSVRIREEPVRRFVLVSRPIKTHVVLKLLLTTKQIFRQGKARKTLTLFYYKIKQKSNLNPDHHPEAQPIVDQ